MSTNIEAGFITELLITGDFAKVADEGLGSRFLSGNYKRAFNYITKHITAYGKVPSIKAFKRKFKDIKLEHNEDGKIGTDEPLEYWIDEVREKRKHNLMADTTESIIELLNEKETEKAFGLFRKVTMEVESEVIKSDRMKITSDAEVRLKDYFERQKTGGMTGLPTGIDHLDKVMGGLNKGELTTFMAYTGVGKTWLEVIIAVHLAKLGYRVLFITTEMATKNIFRRIDAVWNKFNYSEFKSGRLSVKDEKRYEKYIANMAKKSDDEVMLVVEQATAGVTQITAKIEQYKPDVLLVDGAYLLADDYNGDDDWKAVIRIWRALHKVCLSKDIPVVVTTQSKEETGAKLSSINFAKAIAQDCDIIAVLEQDIQQRNDKEADIRFLKLREGDMLSTIYINWNFSTMEYNSIYKEDSKAETLQQAKKEEGVITIE